MFRAGCGSGISGGVGSEMVLQILVPVAAWFWVVPEISVVPVSVLEWCSLAAVTLSYHHFRVGDTTWVYVSMVMT